MKTFHRLVVNTLVASMTNNFVWFALTFWVYLETRSVIASSVIGGGYMLLLAVTGLFFGTFVDRHERKVSMQLSNAGSLAAYLLAAAVYVMAPKGSLQLMREGTLLKRFPRLSEVGSAAALMASDHASAITGATANPTCGQVVD